MLFNNINYNLNIKNINYNKYYFFNSYHINKKIENINKLLTLNKTFKIKFIKKKMIFMLKYNLLLLYKYLKKKKLIFFKYLYKYLFLIKKNKILFKKNYNNLYINIQQYLFDTEQLIQITINEKKLLTFFFYQNLLYIYIKNNFFITFKKYNLFFKKYNFFLKNKLIFFFIQKRFLL